MKYRKADETKTLLKSKAAQPLLRHTSIDVIELTEGKTPICLFITVLNCSFNPPATRLQCQRQYQKAAENPVSPFALKCVKFGVFSWPGLQLLQ